MLPPMGTTPSYNYSRPNQVGYNFKEKEAVKDKIPQNLAKELEVEIKELQQLTKEAKELAEKVFLIKNRKKQRKKKKQKIKQKFQIFYKQVLKKLIRMQWPFNSLKAALIR
jgi:hypothetical protein